MKKNDIILIVIIAALALGIGGYYFLNRTESKNAKVIITVNGELYKEADLYKDQTIEIVNGTKTNTLVIKDGYATMLEAECPDQICVHQKSIHYNGESIICLPNLIMVSIESDEEYKLDSVAN